MKLEDIIQEWKVDAVIDQTKLGDEITRTPMLHAKYLEYFVMFKAKCTGIERQLARMKWLKRRWYRGEMDKTELLEHGWDSFQGLKPSGSELNQLFDMDGDIADLAQKQEYYEAGIKTLEYILRQVQGREYSLKTLFEYQRYLNG